MKAKDIMTKEVISVTPKTKIEEVARIMLEKNFRGIPVVENEAMVGIITESDFLTRDFEKLHIPSLIRIMEDLKVSKYAPEKKESLNSILNADASTIMTESFVYATPETSVTEIVKMMREKEVSPIPIIDENKKILGIVSKADILGIIGKFRDEEVDFIAGK